MNIGIVGGGSIGLLLCSYFSDHHDITLYVQRKEQMVRLKVGAIQLWMQDNYKKSIRVKVQQLEDMGHHDCLFICVKQPQVQFVLPYISNVRKEMPVIFLQNGMGHINHIVSLTNQTYVGIVEHGANRIDDCTVNHLGNGQIVLASLEGDTKRLSHLVQDLHTEKFPVSFAEDWEKLLTQKLLVNAVINPLTAIFNIPNGEIISNTYIQSLAKKLCKEVATILHMCEVESWERVKEIAINTTHNVSSMRADILAHRETEIEAITGYLIEKGQDTPYNIFVYESVLALTEKGRKE